MNVQDALAIVKNQAEEFASKLPDGFHASLGKQVKTMQKLKKTAVVQGKPIYDTETLFTRLFTVRQQRNVDLHEMFQYELSTVPPSIIDEFGYIRKGQKSVLIKHLGHSHADVVLVDGNQLLYHIVWPVCGKSSDIAQNIKAKLEKKHHKTTKYVIFDQYKTLSAKEHERQR